MAYLINGRPGSTVAALDRGLQYGDGLFETLAVHRGNPCLWQRHIDRLLRGCTRLAMPMPDPQQLLSETRQIIGDAACGVVKIILTRGPGGRGYRPPAAAVPTRILHFSDWPGYSSELVARGVRVRLCRTRLGMNPALAGLKTLNRLEQVMARTEWNEPEIHEGIMQDSGGRVVEGTMSNLFLVKKGALLTPKLTRCGTAGVMRELVLAGAQVIGIPAAEEDLSLDDLEQADGVFLTNSLIGIWPVRAFGEILYDPGRVPGTLVTRIQKHGFRFD